MGVCDVYSQTNQSVPLNIKELIINLNIEPASRFKNELIIWLLNLLAFSRKQ